MSNISNLSLNLLMEEIYLKGKINSLNESIISEDAKINVNPVLKQIMSELKANFNFIMTYGVGISGFIGPVKSLLENKGLTMTDYDVALLIIVSFYILISKSKEEIDEIVEKIKAKGFEKEIPSVLDFISKIVGFFKVFGKKFGYVVNGLLDILSFTFLSVPVLEFIKNFASDKGFSTNNIQELLAGVLLAVSTHGLKNLINKKRIQEDETKKLSLIREGKFDFLRDENLVGLEFYNPKEFADEGVFYIIWDQDSSVNSIDIQWEDPSDLDEDGEPMTEYSTMYISTFVDDLNRGFYVLKNLDKSFDLPDPYDVISGLNESTEEFDWVGDIIKKFTPAEEFLYDLMSNLTITESKNSPGWVVYKDEMGQTLMADDINTGDKNPVLYVDYNLIWLKLRDNYDLDYKEAMALCVRMLEMTHKRKVSTAHRRINLWL